MKQAQIIAELERLAEKLGIIIRYERMGTLSGGLCRIGDKNYLFINKSLTPKSKIELIASEISSLDWDSHFVRPEVRRILE
ncbi:hypothetical protein DRQ29_01450 [bacterium]|nr:MAG: hypothetical protein DRQ29_01450 [bacterium]